jgi:hypothetical protein
MDRLEDLRVTLLSVENPFSGHYVLVGEVDPNVVVDHGLSYGSKETAARRRLDFYPDLYHGPMLATGIGRHQARSGYNPVGAGNVGRGGATGQGVPTVTP